MKKGDWRKGVVAVLIRKHFHILVEVSAPPDCGGDSWSDERLLEYLSTIYGERRMRQSMFPYSASISLSIDRASFQLLRRGSAVPWGMANSRVWWRGQACPEWHVVKTDFRAKFAGK